MSGKVGMVGRLVRIVIGVALILWGIRVENWLGAIGILPLLSGLLGRCPFCCSSCSDGQCQTPTEGSSS